MLDLHLGQDKAAVLELHQAIVVWILAVFPEFGYQSWYHNFGWQINSKIKSVSTAEQLHLRSNLDS